MARVVGKSTRDKEAPTCSKSILATGGCNARLADEVACVIEELLPKLSLNKSFPGDAAVRDGVAFPLSIFTPPINRFMVLVD